MKTILYQIELSAQDKYPVFRPSKGNRGGMTKGKIYRTKTGAYYIKLKSGKTKFVKKPGRKKAKRNYKKSKLAFWRRG